MSKWAAHMDVKWGEENNGACVAVHIMVMVVDVAWVYLRPGM